MSFCNVFTIESQQLHSIFFIETIFLRLWPFEWNLFVPPGQTSITITEDFFLLSFSSTSSSYSFESFSVALWPSFCVFFLLHSTPSVLVAFTSVFSLSIAQIRWPLFDDDIKSAMKSKAKFHFIDNQETTHRHSWTIFDHSAGCQ